MDTISQFLYVQTKELTGDELHDSRDGEALAITQSKELEDKHTE